MVSLYQNLQFHLSFYPNINKIPTNYINISSFKKFTEIFKLIDIKKNNLIPQFKIFIGKAKSNP